MKINHAILHVFDFAACENIYAQEEIDISDKAAKNYVARHAKKALSNLDNKRGVFSADSLFAPELKAYFAGERDFVALSHKIADYLVGELEHMPKTPSTDLLVVDFEDAPEADAAAVALADAADDADGDAASAAELAAYQARTDRYFAILLLESKQAYVHEVGMGETGEMNTVSRHRAVLPGTTQKVSSYAVIDLRTLDVRFCDKERTIAGEARWLIPDGLLQCSTQASTREAFTAVTELVEAVADEYGANTAEALSRAKAYATKSVEETEDVDLAQMAVEVFEGEPAMQQRFESAAQARELPERIPLERRAVERVAKSHKIRTDTGIEITFPAEYSESPEYITFTSNSDGTLSIELKNIQHIENR